MQSFGARSDANAVSRAQISGEFTLDQSIGLERLVQGGAEQAVISLDRLLTAFPAAILTDQDRNRVSHGQEIDGDPGSSEWVRLEDQQGHLVAIARAGSRPGSLHPAVVLI